MARQRQTELVSDWSLTSGQPHRVTSGRSNSVISRCTVQNSSHIQTLSQYRKTDPYTNTKHKRFPKSIPQNRSLHKYKTYMDTQTSNTTFWRASSPPAKRARKARTCRYCWPLRPAHRYHIQEKHWFGVCVFFVLFLLLLGCCCFFLGGLRNRYKQLTFL